MYLSDQVSGAFSAEDEELVLALAATAGGAVENARLYEESRRRQQWLQASAEITAALLSGANDQEPLQLITDHVLRLAEADVVSLVLPAFEDPGMLKVWLHPATGQMSWLVSPIPLKAALPSLRWKPAVECGWDRLKISSATRFTFAGSLQSTRQWQFPSRAGLDRTAR